MDDIFYDSQEFNAKTLTPEQLSDAAKTFETLVTTESVDSGNVQVTTTTVNTKIVPASNYVSKLVQGNKVTGTDLKVDDLVNVVVPYARAVQINFNAKKLKPNTKFYAFFNEYNVTEFCSCGNVTANITSFSTTTIQNDGITAEAGNIYSNWKGEVSGVFNYTPTVDFKVPSGKILFRLTDSPTNGEDKESFADSYFQSRGFVTKQTNRVNYTGGGYGSGGGSVPNSSGGYTSVSTPTNTSGSKTVKNTGFVQEALSFVLGVPASSITDEQVNQFSDYFKTNGDPNFVFSEDDFVTYTPGNVYNYDTTSIRDGYTFVNGTSAGSGTTSTGTSYGDIMTSLNILDAINPTSGRYFVDDIKSQVVSAGGQGAWDNMVLPAYEGFKSTVSSVVYANKGYDALPADMKNFWEAGVKAGLYKPNDEASVSKAIANYSAAATLGYLDQTSKKSTTTSTQTKNNGLTGTR